MANIRKDSMKKYNISPHRFMELYHFCLQYNEWKDELNYKAHTMNGVQIMGTPAAGYGISDATAKLASRRAELQKKCELVEQTAMEADEDIYQYILKAVTNEGISYGYLSVVMSIPCSRNTWYRKRKKFYWLLSKKI